MHAPHPPAAPGTAAWARARDSRVSRAKSRRGMARGKVMRGEIEREGAPRVRRRSIAIDSYSSYSYRDGARRGGRPADCRWVQEPSAPVAGASGHCGGWSPKGLPAGRPSAEDAIIRFLVETLRRRAAPARLVVVLLVMQPTRAPCMPAFVLTGNTSMLEEHGTRLADSMPTEQLGGAWSFASGTWSKIQPPTTKIGALEFCFARVTQDGIALRSRL